MAIFMRGGRAWCVGFLAFRQGYWGWDICSLKHNRFARQGMGLKLRLPLLDPWCYAEVLQLLGGLGFLNFCSKRLKILDSQELRGFWA